MLYNVQIFDRNYKKYKIIPMTDKQETDKQETDKLETDKLETDKQEIKITGIYEKHLFHEDVFRIEKDENIILYSSPIRNSFICGVLILSGNKTYGRDIRENGKPGRLLYRFIPNKSNLPIFLVPYQQKHIGFTKLLNNVYAKIQYEEWNSKIPKGKLVEVFGDVAKPENYYEYQLHCKELLSSLHYWKQMNTYLSNYNDHHYLVQSIRNHYNILDIRSYPEWYILTIDPNNSQDLDDALSIRYLENEIIQVSIYISNVPLIVDKLNLWNYLEERVATIYLPHRIIPMLPIILSHNICSLKENKESLCFCLDVFIKKDEIINMNWTICQIKVSKNFSYDSIELHENTYYQSLKNITELLNNTNKYIEKINDSHDLVSYWMIFMNHQSANYLIKQNKGIFRKTKYYKHDNSILGEYTLYSPELIHTGLGLNCYIHITSPIRRIIDILNMFVFQTLLNENDNYIVGTAFYNKCSNKLDKINKEMRSIKKLQNESNLLNNFYKFPELLKQEYECDLLTYEMIDEYTKRQEIYIPKLNLYKTIKVSTDIQSNALKCRLYLFHNEDKFTQKIKVELL